MRTKAKPCAGRTSPNPRSASPRWIPSTTWAAARSTSWRLTLPASLQGVAHRPTREEVLLLLEGELRITLDGTPTNLEPGDVALVPAGSELRLDSGAGGATAWVTTTKGLEAVMADGSRLAPPWAS